MPVPQLLDEIIGHIFNHIKPPLLWLLHHPCGPDYATLRTCCLVSRQFAYWGRHNLYQSLCLATPAQSTHYLSLCRRYSDMPRHIKILDITMVDELWPEGDSATEIGYHDLAMLLDVLAKEGSVNTFSLHLLKSWDRFPPNLRSSVLRFILSKSFESLELANICTCFPLDCIPLPWAAKRFSLVTMLRGVGEDDGKEYWSCPEWEKEKRESGAGKGLRGWHGEWLDVFKSSVERLTATGFFHPEKTKLESLWIPAYALSNFEPYLSLPQGRPCVDNLRELHLSGVYDQDIPSIALLIEACRHTLESLCFHAIRVQSATSSNLSLLTSTQLPRLHTLTIMTDIEPTGEFLKSMAWYLLHARKNQKVTGNAVKLLNLAFIDTESQPARTWAGSAGNTTLVERVFATFKFFKLENPIYDLLADVGKVNLWFMMGSFPGPMIEVYIDGGVEKQFPQLLRERRITSTIGEREEGLMLADALSISPQVPARTRYQICREAEEEKFPNSKETCWKPFLREMRQLYGVSENSTDRPF